MTSKLTRDELLVLLIEECSEVIQAATKCLRFGYAVDRGYGRNDDALAKEVGEASAVIHELRLCYDYMTYFDGFYHKIARAEVTKAKYPRTPPAM